METVSIYSRIYCIALYSWTDVKFFIHKSDAINLVGLHSSELQNGIRNLGLLKRFCPVLWADFAIPHWLFLCHADIATHGRH